MTRMLVKLYVVFGVLGVWKTFIFQMIFLYFLFLFDDIEAYGLRLEGIWDNLRYLTPGGRGVSLSMERGPK
jgi:hypothetical protein